VPTISSLFDALFDIHFENEKKGEKWEEEIIPCLAAN